VAPGHRLGQHQAGVIEVAVSEVEETSDRRRLGTARDLIALINGGSMSKAVCVAAELGIADRLASKAKSVDELARDAGSHAPSLRRLMHALASLNLCTEHEDGSFALTSLGSLLRTDTPDSLRSWIMWCSGYMWPVWGNLLHSVRTGESARKLCTGLDGFDHLEQDEEVAAMFNRAMADVTRLVASEAVRAYEFAGMRRIVDVGGGYGALLATVLKANPDACGVLLDLPHAIAGARVHLAAAGLAERCEFITGSFFDSVPPGADAYVLKTIIHDWDDDQSTIILRNCRRAIPPTGKLLLIEQILPDRFEACARHQAIARADLNMLVGLGGRERTEAEFGALLGLSGFRLARVVPTGLEYCLLEGVPC
jgi:orsellinic acid C2-O-methyltransferase